METCDNCQYWNREITKRFECKDPNDKMFGHIMNNWHWSDHSYTEIEPIVESHGSCEKLFYIIENNLLFKKDDPNHLSSISVGLGDNAETFSTGEKFGCVHFENKIL